VKPSPTSQRGGCPFRELSTSRRNARYRLDLPLLFAPITPVSAASGITNRRSDR